MHEQTSQLRILAALSIVVIALAAGLLFFIPTKQANASTTPTPPEQQPPVHQKLRDAEISLDPTLSLTQTIGGSGDETLVDILCGDDKLYIFGNTSSSDYDFDASGAFVAILDERGKTLGFYSYEGELKAVTVYEGGFVMALERSSPVAVAIDYQGDEIISTAIPTVRDEHVLDIKYADECFLYVTSLEQSQTGYTRLKLTLLDHSLTFIGSLLTDEVYSLEYVDTLDIMGEFRVIANAIADKNMVCMGVWGKKLAHYPLDISYKALDFWFLDDFYYLSHTNRGTELVKADGSSMLLDNRQRDGRLVGDDKYMYVCVGESFFCVDGSKIVFSQKYGDTAFFVNKYVYAASTYRNRTYVRTFFNGNKLTDVSFDIAMNDAELIACPIGIFVVGRTEGKFGGYDLTIAKLNDIINFN